MCVHEFLLERDKSGRVGGSDTGPTVLHLWMGFHQQYSEASRGIQRSNGNNLKSPIKQEIDYDETHRLVGDGELSQVVSNHLWLHLNLESKRKVSDFYHHQMRD